MKILNNIATKEKLFVYGAFAALAVTVTVCLGGMLIFRSSSEKMNREKREEIYVAVNGSIIRAQLEEDFKNPLEIAHKGFLRLFHNYVWSMEPYPEYIEQQKDRAKAMGDGSVKLLFRYLEGDGYFGTIVSGGYSIIMDVDKEDIVIDYTRSIPEFTFTATLKVLRKNDVVLKKMVSIGKIVQKGTVFNNFTGFSVQDLEVLEFKEIKTITYKEL